MMMNHTMCALLHRNPPDPSYARRGTSRSWKMASGRRASQPLAFVEPTVRPPSPMEAKGLRAVDLDVTSTRVDMPRVSQKNFTSAAFRLVWQVAKANPRLSTQVCGLITILDEKILDVLERTWPRFEPSCRGAFFRGRGEEYFDDYSKAVGAVAIIPLDVIPLDGTYRNFLDCVSELSKQHSRRRK